jgi:hypothetical protein
MQRVQKFITGVKDTTHAFPVAFQSIDLTRLRIQNSVVTPAHKPVREQEKETKRERATREHLEKELRRAQRNESANQNGKKCGRKFNALADADSVPVGFLK